MHVHTVTVSVCLSVYQEIYFIQLGTLFCYTVTACAVLSHIPLSWLTHIAAEPNHYVKVINVTDIVCMLSSVPT